MCLHFAEVDHLHRRFGIDPAQDFVVETFLMAVGAALIALSDHKAMRLAAIASIGPQALGIYAIHGLFVQLLGSAAATSSPALWNHGWQIALVPLIFGMSLVGTRVLAGHPNTRKLVS